MPSRIIKESICTSEDLDKLSANAEILFYRLIVKADDYGAYYGNESIVKSTCFPLRSDEIKSYQVDEWLDELAKANLIIRYTAEDGRAYIQFTKWDKHQQIRAKKRKFPQLDGTCKQMISDDSKCARNPIQSNPNPIQSDKGADAPPAPKKRFVKPTLEEVKAYCAERKNKVDADRWYDYYESNGWHVGKNQMKDWKAAVRTWETNGVGKAGKQKKWQTAAEYEAQPRKGATAEDYVFPDKC